MTQDELRDKIKVFARKFYKEQIKHRENPSGYDKLFKFPELKLALTNLLTDDYGFFLKNIDWIAPRPSTFFIRLKNNYGFYLIYSKKSWIAEVEGKKYYLLKISEEEKAVEAIAKLLRYESPEDEKLDENVEGIEGGGGGGFSPSPSPSSSPSSDLGPGPGRPSENLPTIPEEDLEF